ncbi:hypothetical protein QBC34DRAFT_436864 [Podospora aff. communis PSN243]|uniref:Uncharacterized protein n=1 Tax=Podospora aff. communis PSN243 TaxID=3040156 RepID=A0AAV9GR27_9PEZI|nr:hypothetical protein QBC34DRAFT_436864 [Podospora aff. communis PSN243]
MATATSTATVVTHDSELIKFHICATPVPPSRRFFTVRDERGRPLVFSVGLDHVLYALKENSSGARTLVDLSKALAIDDKEEQVSSLDVAQDWRTDDIYLTFTTAPAPAPGDESEPDDDDSAQQAKHRLHVLRPFDPLLIAADSEQTSLQHLLVAPAGEMTGPGSKKITRVFIADAKAAGALYPEVLVSYVDLGSVHQSTDVARIQFSGHFESWTAASDFDLPENASDMLDLCPAVSPLGPGYFALYRIQGQERLAFLTTNKVSGFGFEVALACPAGARALRTYREPGRRGYSALLVGGHGLHHWGSSEYLRAGQPGRLISVAGANDAFSRVVQLDVAQSVSVSTSPSQGSFLSIFAATEAHGVSYARVPASNATFTEPLRAVALVADGLGGAYAPFADPDGLTQHVVVAGKSGVLTLLTQDQATGYWQQAPFYVPDPDKVIECTGYMTRVVMTRAKSSSNPALQVPLAHQAVVMRYPVYTDAIVNGRAVTIGPSGTQVLTDGRGALSYLVPTAPGSIGADMVTLEKANDDGGQPDADNVAALGAPLEIDPTSKVFAKLAELETPKGLRNATLPNSDKKLLANSPAAGDREIEQYAKAVKALGDERRRIKSGDLPAVRASRAGVGARSTSTETIASSDGWSGRSFAVGDNGDARGRAVLRGNFIQEGLEFLADVVSFIGEGIQWALQRIGDRLELWIERTDRPGLRIFLNTLLDITEAAALVFRILFDVIDDLFEFLVAFFDFEAMAVAQRYIVRLLDSGFGVADAATDKAQVSVSAFFDQVDSQVKNLIFPPELQGAGIFEQLLGAGGGRGRGVANADGGTAIEAETRESSVKANYLDYQLTHGGVGASLNRTLVSLPVGGGVVGLIETVITPLLDRFVALITQAIMDLVVLFNDKDDITFGQALSRLTYNLLSGLLDLVEALVNGILELAKMLLASLHGVMKMRINNGFLGWVTGTSDLTAMDITAWIFAPFVHFAYVAINGEGMPKDTPLPDLQAALQGGASREPEAARAKTAGKKTAENKDGVDDEEAPPVYTNDAHVSEAAKGWDLFAGIVEGVVRVVSTVDGLLGPIDDSISVPGSTASGRNSSSNKTTLLPLLQAHLPPSDPRAQLYKFHSSNPLVHGLALAHQTGGDALLAARKAAGGSGGGGNLRAAPFALANLIPWIGTIAKAVGVVVTFPEVHPPFDKGADLGLKLSGWFCTFFDLIGSVVLKNSPGDSPYEEPALSMFFAFLAFWPSLAAAVRDFKDVKSEVEEWPGEETPEVKKRMAALRLSLVFVDGINAIASGFYAVAPSKLLGLAVVGTAASGVIMLEFTVARCWQLESKNFFVCV